MAKAKVWNIEELRKKHVASVRDFEPVGMDDGSHVTKISMYVIETMKELGVQDEELQRAVFDISLNIAVGDDPAWIDNFSDEQVRDIVEATTVTVYEMLTANFVKLDWTNVGQNE